MPQLYHPVAPPVTSAASFGLVNSGTLVKETDDHWQGGFAFTNHLCRSTIRNVDQLNDSNTDTVWAGDLTQNYINCTPAVIDVEDKISTIGHTLEELRKRLEDTLDKASQKALEHEFWTGNLSTISGWGNQHLATPGTTDLTPAGGPVTAKTGLAMLEEAIGSCAGGYNGTIHGTRGAISSIIVFMDKGGDSGDVLLTPLGNMVIAGAGYPGTSPAGVAPGAGTSWLYATGPVAVRLGEMQTFPEKGERLNNAFDTSINNISVRAERFGAASWSGCCTYAIHVTL
jgi:hypothetical protein